MSYELPETDEEVISVVRQEYEGLQQTGGGELKDASFRYILMDMLCKD